MARRRKETFTDKGVLAAPEGLHCDGGGLYLRVTAGRRRLLESGVALSVRVNWARAMDGPWGLP